MIKIDSDWLPVPDNINALPEPLRNYIHNLETTCGSSADLCQENAALRIQVRELTASNAALRKRVQRRDSKPLANGKGGTCGQCVHFVRSCDWPYKTGICINPKKESPPILTVASGADCDLFKHLIKVE